MVKLFVASEWINLWYHRGSDPHDDCGLLTKEVRSAMRRLRISRDDIVDYEAIAPTDVPETTDFGAAARARRQAATRPAFARRNYPPKRR